jgi:hypothetical protein
LLAPWREKKGKEEFSESASLVTTSPIQASKKSLHCPNRIPDPWTVSQWKNFLYREILILLNFSGITEQRPYIFFCLVAALRNKREIGQEHVCQHKPMAYFHLMKGKVPRFLNMFHEILTVLFSGETPYSEGGRNEETA